MKMSKKFRAIASAALISAMVMSMNGMTALAETGETSPITAFNDGVVPITKHLTVDPNNKTVAPNVNFNFAIGNIGDSIIKEDNSLTYMTAGNVEKTAVVFKGLDGGLGFAKDTDNNVIPASFTVDSVLDSTKSYYESTDAKLVYNNDVFTEPGVYHYTLSEVDGSTLEGAWPGIDYAKTVYDVYLFVERVTVANDDGTETESVEVKNIIAYENGKETKGKVGKLLFENDYGASNDTTHDVIITKKVTGNQGNKSQTFDIVVSVEGDAIGEQYSVEIDADGDGTPENTLNLTSTKLNDGDTLPEKNDENYSKYFVTAQVKHNGTIHVYGLTEEDRVTVDEAPYGDDGYTVTYESSASDDKKEIKKVEGLEDSITIKAIEDETTVTVKNEKQVTTPTGIIMSFAPYILVLALAGVFAVMFLRKKREDF